MKKKLLFDIQWHFSAYLTGADREFIGDVNHEMDEEDNGNSVQFF